MIQPDRNNETAVFVVNSSPNRTLLITEKTTMPIQNPSNLDSQTCPLKWVINPSTDFIYNQRAGTAVDKTNMGYRSHQPHLIEACN